MARFKLVISVRLLDRAKTVGAQRRIMAMDAEAAAVMKRVLRQPTLKDARRQLGLEYLRFLGRLRAARSAGNTSRAALRAKSAKRLPATAQRHPRKKV